MKGRATIQEGIVRDELLDVDGHNQILAEARRIIHEMLSLPQNQIGTAQADQILADTKYQLLKKRNEAESYVKNADNYSDKAAYVRDNNNQLPPRTHNLVRLAEAANLQVNDEQKEFLSEITDYNLEVRYPAYTHDFFKKCTEEFAAKKFDDIKEIYPDG